MIKITAAKNLVLLLGVLGFLSSTPVFAGLGSIDYSTVTNLTSEDAQAFMEEFAYGLDYHAYETAAPLGILLGLDVGLEVTSVTLSQGFLDASTVVGIDPTEIPNPLPLPKLIVHKGLPLGFDLGFSFIASGDVSVMGGSVKWAPIPGPFAVAFRLSYNYARVNFIRSRTVTLDALASRRIGFLFEPYGGVGMQFGSGELSIPVEQVTQVGFSSSASFTSARAFAGVRLHLSLVKITGEYTYNFTGRTSVGVKVSLGL